jgi:PmbA protein
MDYGTFKEALFKEALAKGCEAAEAYYSKNEAFSVNVLEGEIETYEVNTKGGLNLRVKYAGRDGYAFTQTLEDPEKLVSRAIDNARSIENEDDHPMQGKCEYAPLGRKDKKAYHLGEAEKIELALSLEKAAKAADPLVQRMEFCGVDTGKGMVRISNTLGLDAADEDEQAYCFAMPITMQDGDMRNAYAFRRGDGIFDVDACAEEAVEKSVSQHGASPIKGGACRVLVKNEAMASMLAAFSSMFSAENAQKGLTLFKDKLGEQIAAESVTVLDDPFYPDYERAFDAEGVPSVTTAVVENGVLRSFLHNLKTARKAGVASTSNGGRAGADAPVSVMPSNFYIKPGAADYEKLVKELNDGLIIVDVSGLHAGLNPVSGEFSLVAKGLLVENGRVVRPVDQITVSGSFMGMLSGVLSIGSDLFFDIPRGSAFGSPSVLFGELMVSGS